MFYNFVINPIVLLYKWLYLSLFGLTGSYGISLLLMSVITFLVTSPFMRWAGRIQKNEKHMQDILKSQIETIKSQSQGAEQHRRISALYKSYAYHPAMAVRSVAGLAVQIPFLIAAYYMLSELPDIKGQPFLIIEDLSKPDGLIGSINVLPILMSVINLMSAFTTATFARKDKLQAALIAFLFLLLLYTAPSALLIFWTCNNLWGLLGNMWKPFAAKRQLTGFGSTIKGKTITDMLTGLSYQFYVILALTTTFCLFVPIDIYIRNSNEFWFSLSDIIWMLLIACLLLTILLYTILKLLRGKARTVYICILFGAAIGFCLQSYIINTDYGVLDGNTIDWSQYQKEAIINSLTWLLCISMPLLIVFFAKTNKFKNIILRTSQGLIIVQIISSIYMFSGVGPKPAENYVLTTEKMFEVSSNKNIIIFILDAFDTEIFQKVMHEDPELLNELDGFTYYPDTVGSYGQTMGALPQILTGAWYENKETYHDFIIKSWKKNPFYLKLKENKYDINVFTSSIFVAGTSPIDNMVSMQPTISSPARFMRDYYKLTAFRSMPHTLKTFFWLYTGDLLKYAQKTDKGQYGMDDVKFYNELTKDRLNKQENTNCFRFYHLKGLHAPFTMNENIKRVYNEITTQYDQVKGLWKIVGEYLRELKDLDVYDDSIIVIMADHGINQTLARSPLLLFKGYKQRGIIIESKTPVSFKNLHASILAAMGENPNKLGIPFFEVNNQPRRFILFDDLKRGGFESHLREYEVNGLATDIKSWKEKIVYPYDITPDRIYRLGKTIDFKMVGNSSNFTVSGWDQPETYLCWIRGDVATIELDISEAKNKNLKLIVDCMPYLANNLSFQKIGVYINNSFITSWKVNKSGRYVAIIPSKINNSGKLFIKFTISNPEVSLAKEGRPIGLGVFQLVVDEADYNYKLGTNLKFKSDNVSKYIEHGWDKAEPFGRWISGEEASLLLDVKAPKEKQLELRLKGFPYLVPGLENQVVGVYVNDQKIDTWYVNKNDWYDAIIAPEIAKDGLLNIKFTVSNPEASREKERRDIGLAVTDIILQEHKE